MHPEAYPLDGRPVSVEVIETHISHIFLTGLRAYKVKKAVNFGFLNFTSLEKRKHFCERELALNQRLSPNVYLEVAEVRELNGVYTIGGSGTIVEYAVVMRQLHHTDAMDQVLARGELTESQVERVAQRIATFHRIAERSQEITTAGGLQTMRENVLENFQQTAEYRGRTVDPNAYARIRAYSEAFMDVMEDTFQRRSSQGSIRDCHGDLHMDHVFVTREVEIIDCIEFNDRYRYADVASDVAFLAMDLDYAGHPDLAEAFQDAYVKASGDTQLPEVLNFYKCYRAYVRAKVDSLRLDQVANNPTEFEQVRVRAEKHVALADAYATSQQPMLTITAGLMGTGKSRVAELLAHRLNAQLISSDVLRKEMAGIPSTERRYQNWEEGLYSPEALDQTYQEMHGKAAQTLASGVSVVLDASYRRRTWRQDALKVAQEAGVPFIALECVCPSDVVKTRLDTRLDQPGVSSDGRWELYQQQAAAFELFNELPESDHIVLDTSASEEETERQGLYGIYKKLLSAGGWTQGALQVK
jgi:aminoglycoside phosphotransferase family enzyme/predicted kinase